ncbi:hypothetical protein C8K36_104253 [Rhodococcus sp. OK519]|uniref:Rv1476 family membrane protein n=1 Tax=Rhodococcus sp. OK519 TaxID=2135729 RepID=UPI000D3DAAEF|nr:hypothetical protein C8K36_104253 [Rhodococcus sp. OK519]
MSASIAPVLLPNIAKIPDDVSLDAVFADLSDDNVSAPASDVEGLRAVVARAQDDGIDLHIVVVESDPRGPEPLRDLATEVGTVEGGTVLVLSPSANGTYSDTVSRVVLERAQDRTFTGNAVDSANNFVDGIAEPAPKWGLVTALLVVLVAAVAGVSFVAKARRGRADAADAPVSRQATPVADEHPAGS